MAGTRLMDQVTQAAVKVKASFKVGNTGLGQ